VRPEDVPDGPLAVDTDAFSFVHLRKGAYQSYTALMAGHQLALPSAVVGELKVGAIRSGIGGKKLEELDRAVGVCVVIPVDDCVVDVWAVLRAKLMNRLAGKGINDIWIAACCLVYDLPLVTNNLKDFSTIATVQPTLRLVHPDL
jgi:predicted nucleic acid-binding protein